MKEKKEEKRGKENNCVGIRKQRKDIKSHMGTQNHIERFLFHLLGLDFCLS